MERHNIAVIGGGPSGIAVARYLKTNGHTPEIFEAHDEIGGQWCLGNPNSGVWKTMRTNTGQFATCFSDASYGHDVAMFPHNWQVLEHLHGVADQFGLREHVHLGAEVTELRQVDGGYAVTWRQKGQEQTEVFSKVVVSSGRFRKTMIPAVPGIDSFSGVAGVMHSHRYRDLSSYRDKVVVIGGSSISALEIASDLALGGARRVYVSQRRQRYVAPKMVQGTPLEYFAFTREGVLAAETATPEENASGLYDLLMRIAGCPSRYGAPRPNPDVTRAGLTGSQHYLNLVAEDRIVPVPWIDSVAGQDVTFEDGRVVAADALIFGTGFELEIPFLSPEIARTVNMTAKGMDLADFTFHPDLLGLAFMGFWVELGPYLPVLEQQARYIAYAWSLPDVLPEPDQLAAGVAACQAEDHHAEERTMNEMSIRFARLAGTDPSTITDPQLRYILEKSAVTGLMFRLVGPDALPDAAERLREQFRRFASPETVAAMPG